MNIISRRNVLKISATGLGVLGLSSVLHPQIIEYFVVRGKDRFSSSDYRNKFRQDKVDIRVDYLKNSQDLVKVQERNHRFLEDVVFKLPIPQHGSIVEFGTYECSSFEKLCTQYGSARCVGYDIFEYKAHPRQIITDIRNLSAEHDRPIAFGWSDCSMWMKSPLSKMAAHKYFMKNIVVGGYYLEDAIDSIPNDITFPGFEVVFSDAKYLLLKRVS